MKKFIPQTIIYVGPNAGLYHHGDVCKIPGLGYYVFEDPDQLKKISWLRAKLILLKKKFKIED